MQSKLLQWIRNSIIDSTLLPPCTHTIQTRVRLGESPTESDIWQEILYNAQILFNRVGVHQPFKAKKQLNTLSQIKCPLLFTPLLLLVTTHMLQPHIALVTTTVKWL